MRLKNRNETRKVMESGIGMRLDKTMALSGIRMRLWSHRIETMETLQRLVSQWMDVLNNIQ